MLSIASPILNRSRVSAKGIKERWSNEAGCTHVICNINRVRVDCYIRYLINVRDPLQYIEHICQGLALSTIMRRVEIYGWYLHSVEVMTSSQAPLRNLKHSTYQLTYSLDGRIHLYLSHNPGIGIYTFTRELTSMRYTRLQRERDQYTNDVTSEQKIQLLQRS